MKKFRKFVAFTVAALFTSLYLFGESETKTFKITETLCPKSITEVNPDNNYMKRYHKTYYSTTCKRERGYNIYLPYGYSEEKKYPVLYLLHGIFGNEGSMCDPSNKLTEIVGNLQGEGKVKEFILVLPNMYAAWDDSQKPGFAPKDVLPYDNFINDLVTDLMPEIESKYSVATGRENTAIAGFSMGGRETLFIILQRPDLFNYACAIAPAPGLVPGKDWAMSHEGQISTDEAKFAEGAELPEVFMICCGTRDSVVGQFPKSYHELFVKNNVVHTWWEVPNADHNDVVIRSGFYNFVQRIFQN